MPKFKKLSGTLYEVRETKGFAIIISYVTMPTRNAMLSDVKKAYYKQNRIKGL